MTETDEEAIGTLNGEPDGLPVYISEENDYARIRRLLKEKARNGQSVGGGVKPARKTPIVNERTQQRSIDDQMRARDPHWGRRTK